MIAFTGQSSTILDFWVFLGWKLGFLTHLYLRKHFSDANFVIERKNKKGRGGGSEF